MRLLTVSGRRLALVGTAAIVGAISVAVVLGLIVKFGREMAGYLETSTGLVVDGTTTTTASPAAVAPAPQLSAGEAPVPATNEDAAELRTTTASIEPEQ